MWFCTPKYASLCLLLLSFCHIASALALALDHRGTNTSSLERRDEDADCIELCVIDGPTSRLRRRNTIELSWDVSWASSPLNYTSISNLEKRVWKIASDQQGGLRETQERVYAPEAHRAYLYLQLNRNNYDTQYGDRAPLAVRGEAPVSVYAKFEDRAFQIGTGGIHGCQVVTVVSSEAVWMAHFWEVRTNGYPPEDLLDGDSYAAFEERMLYHLTDQPAPANPKPGVYKGKFSNIPWPYIPLVGEPLRRSMFPQAVADQGRGITVYIATPVRDNGPALYYAKRVRRIADRLALHLGPGINVVECPYVRYKESDPTDRSSLNDARAQYLFQYDARADAEADVAMAEENIPGRSNGRRQWRFFSENALYRGWVPDY